MNNTKIDSRILSLEIVETAAKSGQVLSVLIAPTSVKFFCKAVIVEFKALSAEKNKALAVALKNRNIPFCAFDKALGGTLGSIPAAHLSGEQVVAKVYPKAQPATRPVLGAPAPEVVKPAPEAVVLTISSEGDIAVAPKKEKKVRSATKKERKPKKLNSEGESQAVG